MSNPNVPEQSSDYFVYDEHTFDCYDDAYFAAQAAEDAAEDARLNAGQYDPYELAEDPLAGSCDPTGGFPR